MLGKRATYLSEAVGTGLGFVVRKVSYVIKALLLRVTGASSTAYGFVRGHSEADQLLHITDLEQEVHSGIVNLEE